MQYQLVDLQRLSELGSVSKLWSMYVQLFSLDEEESSSGFEDILHVALTIDLFIRGQHSARLYLQILLRLEGTHGAMVFKLFAFREHSPF